MLCVWGTSFSQEEIFLANNEEMSLVVGVLVLEVVGQVIVVVVIADVLVVFVFLILTNEE